MFNHCHTIPQEEGDPKWVWFLSFGEPGQITGLQEELITNPCGLQELSMFRHLSIHAASQKISRHCPTLLGMLAFACVFFVLGRLAPRIYAQNK